MVPCVSDLTEGEERCRFEYRVTLCCFHYPSPVDDDGALALRPTRLSPNQSRKRHRKARKARAQNLTFALGFSSFLFLTTRTSIQPSGLLYMKARLGLTSARRFVWPPYWPITISRQILPVVNRTSDITKLSKMCFISGKHTRNCFAPCSMMHCGHG